MDCPDLYPRVAKCLGESILIGTGCQAFAREQHEHFKLGFKAPPQHEIASWSLSPGGEIMQGPSFQIGDIFRCVYTREGSLQLWLNNDKILDFGVGRPLDDGSEYHAVVDVCLRTTKVAILPTEQTWSPQTGPSMAESKNLPNLTLAANDACRRLALARRCEAMPHKLATIMSVGDLPSTNLGYDDDSRSTSSIESHTEAECDDEDETHLGQIEQCEPISPSKSSWPLQSHAESECDGGDETHLGQVQQCEPTSPAKCAWPLQQDSMASASGAESCTSCQLRAASTPTWIRLLVPVTFAVGCWSVAMGLRMTVRVKRVL